MSLCSILIMPVPIDVDNYLGISNEYTQVHVQCPYIVLSPDSYIPLTEP